MLPCRESCKRGIDLVKRRKASVKGFKSLGKG